MSLEYRKVFIWNFADFSAQFFMPKFRVLKKVLSKAEAEWWFVLCDVMWGDVV